jgi:hypothetical protein
VKTLEQQNYPVTTIRELQQEQGHLRNGKIAIVNGGYPIFNECDHTTLDMSHTKNGSENYMHTLSIKLQDGQFITINVMKLSGNETNIDMKAYGENEFVKAINFKDGSSQRIEDVGTLALYIGHKN